MGEPGAEGSSTRGPIAKERRAEKPGSAPTGSEGPGAGGPSAEEQSLEEQLAEEMSTNNAGPGTGERSREGPVAEKPSPPPLLTPPFDAPAPWRSRGPSWAGSFT
eukprot:1636326-Rhodomonas_salina.2